MLTALLLLLLLRRNDHVHASRVDLISSAAIRPPSQSQLPFSILPPSTSIYRNSSPKIRVTFPPNHSYWRLDPHSSNLTGFSVRIETTAGFRIPRDGFVVITSQKFAREYVHVTSSSVISSSSIDPGTHFWSLELWRWGRSYHEFLSQTSLHFEVVVPQDPSEAAWMHLMADRELRPPALMDLPVLAQNASYDMDSHANTGDPEHIIPVCFVTGVSTLYDGQKAIWMQVMRALSRRSDRYKLTIKTFDPVYEHVAWVKALRALNVAIDSQSLSVSALYCVFDESCLILNAEQQVPEHEASSHSIVNLDQLDQTLIESIERSFPHFRNASVNHNARWPVLNDDQLSVIQPPFVARVWQQIVNHLRSCRGGVLTYGNSKTENDRVTLYAARLAGVRAVVAELPNLHPLPLAVDALLAPSHFALYHPSTAQASAVAKHSYVCNTGVDTNLFSPPPPNTSSTSEATKHVNGSFVIGYVGRLSSEKSVGLLIEAAKYLSEECPLCRVRIIGNGPIKSSLLELARDWNLLNVEIISGIYNDQVALVQQLRQMDVYVATCMSETLGLAPLEAMSVGIPVVGFASGGVGEYLQDGYNGLTVKEPTPLALCDAIVALYQNAQLLKKLGRNARRTVVDRFSQQQGTQRYIDLYERLVQNKQDLVLPSVVSII